jgi:uncharacterized membrane protein YozB (DUF420 family)
MGRIALVASAVAVAALLMAYGGGEEATPHAGWGRLVGPLWLMPRVTPSVVYALLWI